MEKGVVSVYDASGHQISSLSIGDTLKYVGGRICIGQNGLYYKGVGIPYVDHYVLNPDDQYKVLEHSKIDYLGYNVIKKSFENLTGIFEEKYQPQFSDFIGSCGNKELSIIENENDFKLSSLKLKKAINWDKTNNQYYFIVDYLCGRRKYMNGGDPNQLKDLLRYMIENDWNFIWDKTSINDVSYNGLVTDIADIFRSSSLSHKLGTIYSILYSLAHINKMKYHEFLLALKYNHATDMDYIFNAVRFLKDCGVDISELYVDAGDFVLYEHIVRNYLLTGRNCAHCSYDDLGEKVMNSYIEKFGERDGKRRS
jgi:hypothetical protein